ncbi:MAG: hypothetical protein HY731_08395 [Candidatus Tectomicrobia bacterium]|nr:hypothetical protein [Candidatus Tectomicrobia bacterium]
MVGSSGTTTPQAAATPPQPVIIQPGQPAAQPTGWDTEYSQRLGIKLLATYDSSGPPGWDPVKHPLVFVTSMGPGYGGFLSKNKLPGFVIIDAETKEVVASATYDLGFKEAYESHGVGVSPDGQWIYIPTGDLQKRDEGDAGRILVINARTLKLHQVMSTKSMPHHFKAFRHADGRELVIGEDFNWQAPAFGVRPGSGIYILDPKDKHRVVGGINADTLQANPYLAFAHPSGEFIYIGLPPGPNRDPDIRHKLEGMWAVVSTKTWEPVKYYKGGYDPIWTAFSPDGQYAYLCDGGSDEVWKIDHKQRKVVGSSRTSVHGAYGCHLGWKPNELWTIEKGEASHNRGKNIGLVDVMIMTPMDTWNTGWLRADHGTVHPNPDVNELWVTANSSFEVVVWDMGKRQVKARIPIPMNSSTHSGAFVKYNPDFTGQMLADQNGLHGSALQKQQEVWLAAK